MDSQSAVELDTGVELLSTLYNSPPTNRLAEAHLACAVSRHLACVVSRYQACAVSRCQAWVHGTEG